MKKKLSNLLVLLSVFPLFFVSCEGSRPRRMIDTAKGAYDRYEETGDSTELILLFILLIVLGVLWIKKQQGK